ncbi:hypothetical protein ANCDUO_26063 [Ancylostoma duodenale]|uniref:Uncharacterized protein n=2 Tax=Ancylostoma TaxID=29169 RepID=A0A0C2FAV9_9BILA|nr:hypothetical protein ANCDUO_26063 [Ancylostoma duodenale]
MIKRILNAVGKKTKDANFQQKAVKKMEEIEKGEKILAPKVPTEEKRFQKAQSDEKVKEILNKKDTTLIDNMNKMNITSTDPVERWTSTKLVWLSFFCKFLLLFLFMFSMRCGNITYHPLLSYAAILDRGHVGLHARL